MSSAPLYVGVELGGTKCVCIVGSGPDDIRAIERLPTRGADETLAHIEQVLRGWKTSYTNVASLGIASFGPIDLDPLSSTYGCIRETTKPQWSHAQVGARLRDALQLPTLLETDVNGAALAEGRWGAARNTNNFAYVTVGTGVGVGLVANGQVVHGFMHSELGHIRVAREHNGFQGACEFHGACVEGLASGPAIERRAGMTADKLSRDHMVWDEVAHALGQLAHVLFLSTAPNVIVFGGGVMQAQPHLYERIRREVRQSLNGYSHHPVLTEAGLQNAIVAPALGDRAGPLGALRVAQLAAERER